MKASQLAQFAASVQHAVTKLQLINNCTADQIDFGTNFTAKAGAYFVPDVNPSRQADGRCDVFGPNGAGLSSPSFDASYFSGYFMPGPASTVGSVSFMAARISGIGTESGEETFFWAYDITADICRALNKSLGITSSLPSANYGVGLNDSYYTLDAGKSVIGSAPYPELVGHPDGCYCYSGAAGECDAYFTIIVR